MLAGNLLVEELAQKQFKYSKLFEDQAAILRKDLNLYQTAYDNVLKSEDIAKENQRWMPNAEEKVAYMKHLEDICALEPKTPDDRMKICFAAHVYTSCLVLLDIGNLPIKDQHKVIKRHMEPQAVEMAKLHTTFVPPYYKPTLHLPEPKIPIVRIWAPKSLMRNFYVSLKTHSSSLESNLYCGVKKAKTIYITKLSGHRKGRVSVFLKFSLRIASVRLRLNLMR